jgi:hypothetical protein
MECKIVLNCFKGGEVMKKIALSIAIVILSTSLIILPAYAITPTSVSGTFIGLTYPVYGPIKTAGANVITSLTSTGEYNSGPMIGIYEDQTDVIWHFGDPEKVKNLPANPMSWRSISSFAVWHTERTFTGTVDSISGSLTIRLEAKFSYPTVAYPSLEGTWVIISGTGELADLHGQGTWWNSQGQVLRYDGQMHFD